MENEKESFSTEGGTIIFTKIKRTQKRTIAFVVMMAFVLLFSANVWAGEADHKISVTHIHAGDESAEAGCYTLPEYHVHEGSSDVEEGCHTIPVYHIHEGDLTTGGSCFKTAVYHVHTGNGTGGGGCYGQPLYHSHSGNSSNGGGCYTKANYHTHSGSSTGGGCYTVPVYHAHTAGCESTGRIIGHHSYSGSACSTCGASTSKYWKSCNYCGETTWTGSGSYCPNGHGSGGGCTAGADYGAHCTYYTCGKTTSTVTAYNLGCGKTTATVESYSLNCGKTTATIEGYSLNCGKTAATVETYLLSCPKTTFTVDSYALGCQKTEKTLERYLLNCGKTEDTQIGSIEIMMQTEEMAVALELSVSAEGITPLTFLWEDDSKEESLTVTENGTFYCAVTYEDTEELHEVQLSFTVSNIDHTPPTIHAIKSDTASDRKSVTLCVMAEDIHEDGKSPGAGLHEYAYSWDHGRTWIADNSWEITENDTYTVQVRDRLGNQAEEYVKVDSICMEMQEHDEDTRLSESESSLREGGTALESGRTALPGILKEIPDEGVSKILAVAGNGEQLWKRTEAAGQAEKAEKAEKTGQEQNEGTFTNKMETEEVYLRLEEAKPDQTEIDEVRFRTFSGGTVGILLGISFFFFLFFLIVWRKKSAEEKGEEGGRK